MAESDWLAEGFEKNRPRLRAVAYRMLGAWLTTIVARVCLNMLRSRNARREEPMDVYVPDPVISRADGTNPEMRRCWPTRSGSRCTWCWKH